MVLGVSDSERLLAVCFSIQSESPQQNSTWKGNLDFLSAAEMGLVVPAPGMKNNLQKLHSELGVNLLTSLKQVFQFYFSQSSSLRRCYTILLSSRSPKIIQFKTRDGVNYQPFTVFAKVNNILLLKELLWCICSYSLSFSCLSVNLVPTGEIRINLSTLLGYLKEQLAAMQPPKECPTMVNLSIPDLTLHSSIASMQYSTIYTWFSLSQNTLLPDSPMPMKSRACTLYFCERGTNSLIKVSAEPPQPCSRTMSLLLWAPHVTSCIQLSSCKQVSLE